MFVEEWKPMGGFICRVVLIKNQNMFKFPRKTVRLAYEILTIDELSNEKVDCGYKARLTK